MYLNQQPVQVHSNRYPKIEHWTQDISRMFISNGEDTIPRERMCLCDKNILQWVSRRWPRSRRHQNHDLENPLANPLCLCSLRLWRWNHITLKERKRVEIGTISFRPRTNPAHWIINSDTKQSFLSPSCGAPGVWFPKDITFTFYSRKLSTKINLNLLQLCQFSPFSSWRGSWPSLATGRELTALAHGAARVTALSGCVLG